MEGRERGRVRWEGGEVGEGGGGGERGRRTRIRWDGSRERWLEKKRINKGEREENK